MHGYVILWGACAGGCGNVLKVKSERLDLRWLATADLPTSKCERRNAVENKLLKLLELLCEKTMRNFWVGKFGGVSVFCRGGVNRIWVCAGVFYWVGLRSVHIQSDAIGLRRLCPGYQMEDWALH